MAPRERLPRLDESHPDVARMWHPTANIALTPSRTNARSHQVAWWRAGCGHEWTAEIAATVRQPACPVCDGRKVVTGVNDLATTHPHLANQWHPTKNSRTATTVVAANRISIHWICELGHEWKALVSNRTAGGGCPECALLDDGRNTLAARVPDIAAQWHPAKNLPLTAEAVIPGSSRRVWWLGPCGHEWQAVVSSRCRGRGAGCPYCARKAVLTGFNDLGTARPDLVAQWHPTKNGNRTLETTINGTKRPVWWAGECGHEWERPPSDLRDGRPNECPTCIGRRVLSGFNDLTTVAPDLAAQWHPTKNDPLTPAEVTIGSSAKVWWKGDCGHEWQAIVAARSTGRKSGCPLCANKVVVPGVNDLTTLVPELAAQWHATKNVDLTPAMVPAGSSRIVWWQCPTHPDHEWQARIAARLAGQDCPRCATQGTSKIEAYLREALADAGETIRSDGALEIRWGRLNRPAHCDIVLPDRYTVIEYDGSYWHRDQSSGDTAKTQAILAHGWRVVRIREHPLPFLELEHPHLTQIRYDFVHTPREELRTQIITLLNGRQSGVSCQAPPQ